MTDIVDELEDLHKQATTERSHYYVGSRCRLAMEEIEKLREALDRIDQWSRAYPLDIFPEPDLKKAAELLKAGGITLDSISAHCMRHVIEGVGKIAREARGR